MISKNEILNFLQKNKEFIKSNFHITKIGLFGSFAKDTAHENSDIDIIIELEDGVPDIFETKLNLQAYIKDNLNLEVDICREKYLKPYVKNEILKDTVYV